MIQTRSKFIITFRRANNRAATMTGHWRFTILPNTVRLRRVLAEMSGSAPCPLVPTVCGGLVIQLLRAMTPLYLAWVASFAIEMDSAMPAAVDRRLEQLCQAYESGKPYVLSRWRWPDRFNP